MKVIFAAPLSILLLSAAPSQALPDKYNITPEERAACDDDAVNLCSDSYPDEDQLLLCMQAKRTQLKHACRAALTAGLRKRHMAM